jgi:hypothetical protein
MSGKAPSNAVTRLYGPAQGRDWVTRHWDEFVAIHALDVVVEARTAVGQRYRVRGRDAAVSEARSLSDVGLKHLTMEPLSVHGDRLALIRWVNWTDETEHGGGPASVEQVVVVEADADGRVAEVLIFEPDDAALAEAEFARRAQASG